MTADPIVLEVEDVLTDPRLTREDLDLFRLEVLAVCRQTRGLLARRAAGADTAELRTLGALERERIPRGIV